MNLLVKTEDFQEKIKQAWNLKSTENRSFIGFRKGNPVKEMEELKKDIYRSLSRFSSSLDGKSSYSLIFDKSAMAVYSSLSGLDNSFQMIATFFSKSGSSKNPVLSGGSVNKDKTVVLSLISEDSPASLLTKESVRVRSIVQRVSKSLPDNVSVTDLRKFVQNFSVRHLT